MANLPGRGLLRWSVLLQLAKRSFSSSNSPPLSLSLSLDPAALSESDEKRTWQTITINITPNIPNIAPMVLKGCTQVGCSSFILTDRRGGEAESALTVPEVVESLPCDVEYSVRTGVEVMLLIDLLDKGSVDKEVSSDTL